MACSKDAGLGLSTPKDPGSSSTTKEADEEPQTQSEVLAERIDAALLWLAHHQSDSGAWEPHKLEQASLRLRDAERPARSIQNVDFVEEFGREEQVGDEHCAIGLTGLSLLAFTSQGHTHLSGPYRQTIKRALDWIREQQDIDGCFGPRDGDEYIYNHAICAKAICDLYAATKDVDLKASALFAISFTIEAQNPGLGWRYGVKPGDNDTSITCWAILALDSIKQSGLKFRLHDAYEGANKWVDLCVEKGDDGYITCGYRGPGMRCARLTANENYDRNACMNGCAILIRLLTDNTDTDDSRVTSLLPSILHELPTWRVENDREPQRRIDMYFWYFCTLALSEVGGDAWTQWSDALIEPTLLTHQRGWHASDVEQFGASITKTGDASDAGCWQLDEHGSWDPVGAWGVIGGRIHATAFNALTLSISLDKLEAGSSKD